jgi:hypothetical protein
LLALAAFPLAASADDAIRFEAVNVILASDEPVAAWQFELNDRAGSMKVVGVEQGESAAFDRAPYYDRDAVQLGQADRIVVADYSLAAPASLPSGRTRIATIHLMLRGETDFDLDLITATDSQGRVIDATVSLEPLTGSEE